jgi:hypothetical protein
MEPRRFDQLTKTLASSTSRRQALKAAAVAAVGGVLGWRATGTASAQGNSACAHWCAAVFGADTPAAGQCTSAAAHGTGLCYTCGPASPGGGVAPAAICCTHTSSGYCASYSGAACCSPSQTCSNGTCVTPTTTTTAAPTTTPPPTTTTTTTAAPQFERSCVCGNGFTATGICTDLDNCQADPFCSIFCEALGGVSSATCVPC